MLWAHHSLFEPALALSGALADRDEVHLVVEVPHGGDRAANFGGRVGGLAPGLHDADPVLSPEHPEATRALWRSAASARVLVTSEERSSHPESVRLVRRVLHDVADLRPDVVHLDDVDVSPRLALALPTVRRRYGLVVGVHDPEPHSGDQDRRTKAVTRRLLLPRADAVVVHHAGGREALVRRHRWLRVPVRDVPLGVYGHLAHALPEEGPETAATPTVALFGRLTPYKGLDLLYAAAPTVAAAVPGVRFVVAGEPAAGYEPPTPPPAVAASIDVRRGYLTTEEIGRLCRDATVVVCPYTDASQSGVVLTAYAFGAPVVVTDVGGLPEYVDEGRTGLVVPPGDPAALAAALVRVLVEPGLAARMRDAVRETVAGDLSWSRSAAVLRSVYREVAGRRDR